MDGHTGVLELKTDKRTELEDDVRYYTYMLVQAVEFVSYNCCGS